MLLSSRMKKNLCSFPSQLAHASSTIRFLTIRVRLISRGICFSPLSLVKENVSATFATCFVSLLFAIISSSKILCNSSNALFPFSLPFMIQLSSLFSCRYSRKCELIVASNTKEWTFVKLLYNCGLHLNQLLKMMRTKGPL